jgi:hypothetical protein
MSNIDGLDFSCLGSPRKALAGQDQQTKHPRRTNEGAPRRAVLMSVAVVAVAVFLFFLGWLVHHRRLGGV